MAGLRCCYFRRRVDPAWRDLRGKESDAHDERGEKKYGDFVLRAARRGAAEAAINWDFEKRRRVMAAAGTELYSSPHCGAVSERRYEDTPKMIRPDAARPASARWSVFRSGCKRRLADIWSGCRRQAFIGVLVIYCPDCHRLDWPRDLIHRGPYSPDVGTWLLDGRPTATRPEPPSLKLQLLNLSATLPPSVALSRPAGRVLPPSVHSAFWHSA